MTGMTALPVDAMGPLAVMSILSTKLEQLAKSGTMFWLLHRPTNRHPMNAQRSNLLSGAKEIAAYLYGDEAKFRKVYKLAQLSRPPHRFPIHVLGGTLVARISDIEDWFQGDRYRLNDNTAAPANDDNRGGPDHAA